MIFKRKVTQSPATLDNGGTNRRERASLQITHMKTNHMTDPLGVWMTQPVFSWVTEDTPSKRQVSARVRISQDVSMAQPCFDSGLGDWDSRAYQPDFTPAPRTRYYWQVTVTGDAGDSAEATAWFETGKQDEPWQAAWITPDAAPQTHPLLRRAFRTEDVTRARIYATGMGAYYLFLNGARVGDEYLAPGCNDYSSWVQVQAYDVTPLLRAGENVLGAMLGNSWAKGRFGLANEGNPLYCDRFALLCELHLTHADGTETVITSDDMWRWENGPVTDSSIYDGETYDARLLPEGWAAPEFDDTVWKPVVLWQSTLGPTRDRLSPPVKINRTFRPVEVIHTPAGETVLDLGQNIVGWLRMHVNAPAGTEISLWHGETLQQGNFYRDNLRSAKAEYHYISDGRPAEVQPWFTFFGFRYVKIEGWPGEPDLADFTACAVYSELEELGELETSHPLVNRLIQNALWSQRDNFLDVPTDCPQRDEREGWTGDAQVFSGTAMFNMDCTAFYLKYTYDMYMEQLKNHGCVPDVIPNVNRYQEGGRKPTGACAWADAATVIPWNTYVYSGDPDVLRRQLASMRAWVDYVTDFGVDVANSGGWLSMFHFGDWLALDGDGGPDGVMGGTEVAFLAAAYHVYSAELTARAARALGETEVAAQYQARADQIRADMQHEYFTPGGRGALQTQTFYVVSLFMRICPEPAGEDHPRAGRPAEGGQYAPQDRLYRHADSLPGALRQRLQRPGLSAAPQRGPAQLAVRGKDGRDNHLGALELHQPGRKHLLDGHEQPEPLLLWLGGRVDVSPYVRPEALRERPRLQAGQPAAGAQPPDALGEDALPQRHGPVPLRVAHCRRRPAGIPVGDSLQRTGGGLPPGCPGGEARRGRGPRLRPVRHRRGGGAACGCLSHRVSA